LPNEKVAPAQVAALQKWGAPAKDPYAYLKKITQPALVVNGSNDVIRNCFFWRQIVRAGSQERVSSWTADRLSEKAKGMVFPARKIQ
jgi:hypothetical protein